MFKPPVIFTTFCGKGTSNAYVAVSDTVKLKTVLDGKLQEFNESNAMMDLVLFDQAMVSTAWDELGVIAGFMLCISCLLPRILIRRVRTFDALVLFD